MAMLALSLRGVIVLGFTTLVTALDHEWHVGTTAAYSEDGRISIKSPSTKRDHHLFLFLSQSNNIVPFKLGDGWKRLAECVKSDNKQEFCWQADDCTEYDDNFDGDVNFLNKMYCDEFPDGTAGVDLSTVVYYRKPRPLQPRFRFQLRGKGPTWAIITAIRSDQLDKGKGILVRDVATESCDLSHQSHFPSVYGIKGDVLLLSMAFDDSIPRTDKKFKAPRGSSILKHASGPDDMGYLYGATIETTGETGVLTTRGEGGNLCKDALISLVLATGSSAA